MQIDGPNRHERLLAGVFRLYPFLRGRGGVANSTVAKRLLPVAPRVVWARVEGFACAAPLDDLVGRAAFLMGDLDGRLRWVLNRIVGKGAVALDVGANIGMVSLQLARLVGPTGVVHAFEPNPRTLALTRATVAANPAALIRLHEIGLGAENARLNITMPKGNAGKATMASAPLNGGCDVAEVPVRRLSDVLAAEGIDHVDIVKIDVEGFEAQVLRGLFDSADAPRPHVIVFEDHHIARSETRRILENEAYDIYCIPKNSIFRVLLKRLNSSDFHGATDFLAVHRTAPRDRLARIGAGAP